VDKEASEAMRFVGMVAGAAIALLLVAITVGLLVWLTTEIWQEVL
jgi:hypothetical protein